MYAQDFEYDGRRLSDFGFIICSIDSSSTVEAASAGSNITFNKVSRHYGKTYSLTSAPYESCISTTFDVCKNPELYDMPEMVIEDSELRDMMRWLNRREFLPFRIYDEYERTSERCTFYGSFNIERILINDTLYGLRLTLETNSPFGYGDLTEYTFEINNNSVSFIDESDEIGILFPNIEITCKAAGTLQLSNNRVTTPTIIQNCTNGEVITIDGENQIITTSNINHSIMDDFNFRFFKIVNSYDDRENTITSSIPITLKLAYMPIIKHSL